MRKVMKGIGITAMATATFGCAGTADVPEKKTANIKVMEQPCFHIAYVEWKGNYEANPEVFDEVLSKLISWAAPKNLWDFPGDTKLILVYPDGPEVPIDQRRLRVAITVPEGTVAASPVMISDIEGGRYAVGSFELTAEKFGAAWSEIYEWIYQNGFVPAEGLSYEIQKNVSHEHPEQLHFVDICVPLRGGA